MRHNIAPCARFSPYTLATFDNEDQLDDGVEFSFRETEDIHMNESTMKVAFHTLKSQLHNHGKEESKGISRQFVSPDLGNFRFLRNLNRKKGRDIDSLTLNRQIISTSIVLVKGKQAKVAKPLKTQFKEKKNFFMKLGGTKFMCTQK